MQQLATGFYHWCILLHLAGLGLRIFLFFKLITLSGNSGVAIGGAGGAAAPLVEFCYDQSEIYKFVIFRNRPILDNK